MTIRQRLKNVLKRCDLHKSFDHSQRAAGEGWVWPTHGTRICIKRKKITYGKFFDFCAEQDKVNSADSAFILLII